MTEGGAVVSAVWAVVVGAAGSLQVGTSWGDDCIGLGGRGDDSQNDGSENGEGNQLGHIVLFLNLNNLLDGRSQQRFTI